MKVATVLTVYGIETLSLHEVYKRLVALQQYLPFTVLKLKILNFRSGVVPVATVLTVYGIETEQQR